MQTLTADECRVLGVLIEKAQTTPAQYPLSLNALTVGCNQKNNREPVTELSEERVFDAVDSLRRRGLVRETMLSGSRVSKFKHEVREKLAVSVEEMVLLAELWLRGPQSAGELRGRAVRMHALGSIEDVQRTLEGMMQPRPVMASFSAVAGPMVKEVGPSPGERAVKYAQLLDPDLHPVERRRSVERGPDLRGSSSGGGGGSGVGPSSPGSPSSPGGASVPSTAMDERVRKLEAEVAGLRAEVERLAGLVGG